MAKTLYYFDLNGLAESIRYMLHYGGVEFEDYRYERKTWPIKEVKDSLPYGQLPLYKEGNRTLTQSLAIARYVASQTNLLPTDPWDQAVLDAVVFNVYDFDKHVIAVIHEDDPTKKEFFKQELLKKHLDFYFSRFEKELKAGDGYFGGKLSWADFIFIGIVETANLFLDTEIEDGYPTIQSLFQKIRTLPGVKDYIAVRKPYTA